MQTRQADAVHLAVLVTLAALLQTPLMLSGCGDDEGSAENGSKKTTGSGGSGAKAVKPLAANKAGAACETDKDCGGGTCSQQLSGGAAALFGAGMLDAPGGYCTSVCSANADCGEGGTCITSAQGSNIVTGLLGAGAAMPGAAGAGATPVVMGGAPSSSGGSCYGVCKGDDGCRDGYRCVNSYGQPINETDNGTCQPTPATDKLADDVVGKACTGPDECGGAMCLTTDQLTMSTFNGGYCSGRCLGDADCGSTGRCSLVIPGNTGTCYLKCEDDTDCTRDGYRCKTDALAGTVASFLPMQNVMEAPPGKQCQPGAPPLPDGVAGKACTGGEQCGTGICMTEIMNPFGGTGTPLPGGYCSQSCADDTDCGEGGTCSGALGAIAPGTCFKACSTGNDCRDDYLCGPPPMPSLPGGITIPGLGGATGPSVCAPKAQAPADSDAGTP